MDDWKIERSKKKCQQCPRVFEIGDAYISYIGDDQDSFERIDICHDCWQSAKPSAIYAYWETEVQEPKKPKMIVDDNVLFDFFMGLENTSEQNKIEFRYILALMLMRKRFLSFEDMRVENGVSFMTVGLRGGGHQDVIDPGISEQKIVKLQKELNSVFTIDIVEKPNPLQLALPANLYLDAKAEDVIDCAHEMSVSYVVMNTSTVPLSADIARCETIRDYAKDKQIQIPIYQSGFRILESKTWRKVFDVWLMPARAMGSKLISVRCGFNASESIDLQMPELIKRLNHLTKRCLRYKLKLVVESDELNNQQLEMLLQSQDDGFLLHTLMYQVTANADELANKITQVANSCGYGLCPLVDIDYNSLSSWVRAMITGNFSGVVLPVNLGLTPSSEELKNLVKALKKYIDEAQA